MLKFNDKGIYCEQADVYIDPWQPVEKAIITHAHSDHTRRGCQKYLCHTDTAPLLRFRLGNDIAIEAVAYRSPVFINGVKISLHPAGHIIGSAQVRLEYKGEVWVVSGDYKLQDDKLSAPFEVVPCHSFVTESTFALPVYKFPDPEDVYREMNKWWEANILSGINSVIIGYALGKAQRIIHHLDDSLGHVYTHGAVDNVNRILQAQGMHIKDTTRVTGDMQKKDIKNAIIVAPPSAIGSTWMNRFAPYSLGICSGWMQLRGARRRRSADRGFILSDHCDWQQLNEAVTATGAESVYVTHGYQFAFSKWLKEEKGLDAYQVETLYGFNEEDHEEA